MKFVTFEVKTALGRFARLGILTEEPSPRIIDVNAACRWILAEEGRANPVKLADTLVPDTMRAFLEMGEDSIQATRRLFKFHQDKGLPATGLNDATLVFQQEAVTLLAPLPNPNSLRDFLAFEVHTKSGFERRKEPMPEEWYQLPVYYKGNHRTIVGPETDIQWPYYTEKLDYELELACIIGKEGRNISVEDAADYIFGYAILNDFSARDIQAREMKCRLGPAKGKDFASAIGPWVVTRDEVGDARNLRMTAKINGETWSDGNSGTSHWTFEQMIAHVSMDETLYPGDILGSGTVGNGCGLELNRWLQPGDKVELAIDKLGVLKNTVVKL